MNGVDTVVFLHAMGSSHRMWRPQLDALAGRYQVVAPDLPGHADDQSRFSMSAAVSAVRARTAQSQRLVLVGCSLGATVALRVALTEPRRTAGLLLSGTMVTAPRTAMAIQSAVTAVLPLRWTAALSARMVRPAPPLTAAQFAHDIRRAGKAAQRDSLRELLRDDVAPRLGDITAPALVCCGERDRMNLPSAQLLAQRLPAARLNIVDGGDHLWNLQQPARFSALLEDFLTQCRGTIP
jgi:3-oxoadipate enol-lactonase